ncbi:hypothetical protein [Pseudonocardia sp.]|jgi:hypothetical protein|uniref:hypothetical protein n=1 Tax=Pseudonocardia sp. TaxID=60912 RepID=UPI0031FD6E89
MPTPADPAERAAAVASAVLAHPGVARLDGGPFGSIASHLPGRRVLGVRLGVGDEPVEIAVVAHAGGGPLPRLAEQLTALVREVLGDVDVEVTVADVAG